MYIFYRFCNQAFDIYCLGMPLFIRITMLMYIKNKQMNKKRFVIVHILHKKTITLQTITIARRIISNMMFNERSHLHILICR